MIEDTLYLRWIMTRPRSWPTAAGAFAGYALARMRAADGQAPETTALAWQARSAASWPDSIRLASRVLPIDGGIDWAQAFGDPEDTSALHRFGWLLRERLANPARVQHDGLAWIDDWVAADRAGRIPAAGWDAYSTSERMVNWLVGLRGTPLTANLRMEVDRQAEHLLAHLEDRGRLTNNHILNNARALYMAGVFFGVERFARIGRAIVERFHGELFTSGDFLREGSSHYHFLLTRSYLELLWCAREARDEPFESWLLPRIERMAAVAEAFLVRNGSGLTMPLIGDISPDFEPEWFYGLVLVASRWTSWRTVLDTVLFPSGWHSLWLVSR